MAIVTIVLSDDADDAANVSVEFDPPVKRDGELTTAQGYAVHMLDSIADGIQDAEVSE